MKTNLPRPRVRRGYTLIELSLGMMMGIMTATMVLAIFNQQISFLQILNRQSFLATEAPLINNYVARVIGSAEGYQLYSSIDVLKAGGDSQLGAAPVLMLTFKEPNGAVRASVLSFVKGDGLYFRPVNAAGVLGEADWALSKKPRDVSFSVVAGNLLVTIEGPQGEVITYAGTQQL